MRASKRVKVGWKQCKNDLIHGPPNYSYATHKFQSQSTTGNSLEKIIEKFQFLVANYTFMASVVSFYIFEKILFWKVLIVVKITKRENQWMKIILLFKFHLWSYTFFRFFYDSIVFMSLYILYAYTLVSKWNKKHFTSFIHTASTHHHELKFWTRCSYIH